MKKLRLCGLLALQMFACSVTNGQTSTQLHGFNQHVKAYSVMNSTDGPHPDETVRAGTMYYTNLGPNTARLYDPWAYPHFLQVDNADNITVSKIYGFRSVKAYVRAVSIVGDGNTSPDDAKYYITCQARVPINAAPWDLTGDRDCIVVLTVDRNGNVLQDAMIIRPNVTNNPNTPENFYPLHSLWHSNGSLYICGYVTDDNTHAPNEPMFRHSASNGEHIKSFVIKCDPASGTVLNTFTYNTRPTTPQVPHLEEDYDIAVRLTEMGGDVHVTGSVNNVRQTPWPPNADVYFSSTMNLRLDPNNLTMLSTVNDHFGFPWNSEGGNGSEYGVAIEEAVNGNKFIVSNAFGTNNIGNQSFTAIRPHQFMITEIDNNYSPMGGNTRYHFMGFDNAWALTTLPVLQTVGPGQTRLLIAGMAINHWCYTGSVPHGSMSTVMPFLHEVVMQPGTTDGGTFMKWITYGTVNGTGLDSDPLSYIRLQDGVSNMAWNPVFASRARGNVDSNIHMYAPMLNAGGAAFLDHKSMSVEGSYNFSLGGALLNLYKDNTTQCLPSNLEYFNGSGYCAGTTVQDAFVYEPVSQIGYSGNPIMDGVGTLDYEVIIEDMTDIASADYAWTSTACDYSAGNYKTTNIPQLMAGKEVKMYPNPAQHELHVVLPTGTLDNAGILITLSNIYGQRVATLYNGSAADMDILQLPNVASGMYVVELRSEGNVLHQQKLAIQQ